MINRKELERLVWKHTHRNSRGKFDDGTKTVLHLIPTKGTCCVPLSSLSDAELFSKIPRSARPSVTDAECKALGCCTWATDRGLCGEPLNGRAQWCATHENHARIYGVKPCTN